MRRLTVFILLIVLLAACNLTVNEDAATPTATSAAVIPSLTSPPATQPPAPTSQPAVERTVATFNVDINVRRGPSTRFDPPLGTFDEGAAAEIIAVNPGQTWYKVTYAGGAGWVFADLVTSAGNLDSLPVDPGPPLPTLPPVTNTPIATEIVDPTNRARDPGFEGAYVGRGRGDINTSQDWLIWWAESPRTEEWMNFAPVAFPHINPPEIRSGGKSQNLNRNYATFTTALYQQVDIIPGAVVNASAWAWVHTCDPQPAICGSDSSSGARVRIGISPTGGTNPFDGSVVWSNFASPHDHWGQVAVSTRSDNGSVTIFLFATQDFPKGINTMYWDDAVVTLGS